MILQIKNLKKIFPNGVTALNDVSFDVKAGEFLVVIGLSGSGKSTLLRCLNQMHSVSSGQIFFKNQEITNRSSGIAVRQLRSKMGMIFQHFNLIPRHSVLRNVLVGKLATTSTLKSLFGFFSRDDQLAALNALKMVGIEEKAYQRADQLSGGQQQRVAIARALAQNPEILLADEPVASLDPATCHVVMDYLKKINQELGITIICNLHFLSLVRKYATRVVALKNGSVVYNGTPDLIDQVWFKKIYGESAQEVSS